MTKTVYCDDCGYLLANGQRNLIVVNESKVNIGAKKLVLTYFACPRCRKIYRVQLKDARFFQLAADLENAKHKLGHSKRNLLVLQRSVLTREQRLKEHADNLNKKYPGTFTFASLNKDKDGKIVYLP